MNIPHRARRAGGFSVVELMVSLVIGLLALAFATKLVVGGEQSKAVSLGGSDAMQNGMLALFSLSGDAGQSGWGINDNRINGCDTLMTDANGYKLLKVTVGGATTAPLAPVVIQSNGAASDQIEFNFSGSSDAAASVGLFKDYKLGDTTLTSDTYNAYGYAPTGANAATVVLATHDPAIAGGKCAIGEIAALTPNNSVFTLGGGRYAAPGGLGEPYTTGLTRVFNLGPENLLAFHTWSVKNGVLMLQSTNLAGAAAAPVSVMDNVVAIKAQYGFDTSPAVGPGPKNLPWSADNGMVVSQWSGPMIDADGDGAAGGPGDYQRIAAIRIAVVARSKNPEKPDVKTGLCTATVAQPKVFTSASPATTAPVSMTVNVTVAGDTIDWKCYRYRVFETIVPMRNLEWRP